MALAYVRDGRKDSIDVRSGSKAEVGPLNGMSGLSPIADIGAAFAHVRFVPTTDMLLCGRCEQIPSAGETL